MMMAYSRAFYKDHKIKTFALCLSLAIYFALVVTAATLHQSIPEIARLPLKQIGVQTIVQKTGKIPEQMVDAIFPHSNAPISQSQFEQLSSLPFVELADMGLYFWYFDSSFFKAILGVDANSAILMGVLKNNVNRGRFQLGERNVLVTRTFSDKTSLMVGDTFDLGTRRYTISGVLRANISGNIIPADIYMDINDALEVSRDSSEMRKIYALGDAPFGNVVLLKTDPSWLGDKSKHIMALDKKMLIFSEKTFTEEITGQLGFISQTGRFLFLLLGTILALAFGLLTLFNLKSRETEISILRMIGWKVADLKKQFIGENLALLGVSILLGSLLSIGGLLVLSQQTITMELPWDISARPHFLPEENAIERAVTAQLPVHFDATILMTTAVGFLLLSLLVSMLAFHRIKHIKPFEINR